MEELVPNDGHVTEGQHVAVRRRCAHEQAWCGSCAAAFDASAVRAREHQDRGCTSDASWSRRSLTLKLPMPGASALKRIERTHQPLRPCLPEALFLPSMGRKSIRLKSDPGRMQILHAAGSAAPADGVVAVPVEGGGGLAPFPAPAPAPAPAGGGGVDATGVDAI
jgi:hypothetical protein